MATVTVGGLRGVGEEAVLWNGGEGTNAKNAYVALSSADKSALIAFLQSLAATLEF